MQQITWHASRNPLLLPKLGRRRGFGEDESVASSTALKRITARD